MRLASQSRVTHYVLRLTLKQRLIVQREPNGPRCDYLR